MIEKVLEGDLFSSKCQTWVNTVNTVGIMGKGVALEFRNRFPDMYKDYRERCERGEVVLGKPYLYKRLIPPWILNFPTKRHWRSMSNLADIVAGMEYLRRHYEEWGITSMAVPPLGCGQGQLEWGLVGPTMYKHLNELDIPVELYAPHGTAAEELNAEFLARPPSERKAASALGKAPALRPGLIALVEILKRIEAERYRWPVGRTMFQKLAYFATREGLNTGLRFERGSFGPFAPDLKVQVTRLLNNGLIEERQLGRMFEVRVGPTYEDARVRFENEMAGYRASVDRIADLFLRMNTTQAELAATVHHTASELAKELGRRPTENEVFDGVMEWKRRRRPAVDRCAAAKTIRHLASLGWLDVAGSRDLPIPQEVELFD